MPRQILFLLLCCSMLGVIASAATSKGGEESPSSLPSAPSTPRNLKVLPKDIPPADLIGLMLRYSGELGVQCQFCHAEGPQGIDFVSDQSPAKQTARVMIGMLSDINTRYLAQVSDRRYSVPLTCGNCHQGQTTPPVYEAKP
jgi:Photosynthetic reaction centre cytochrome C subunit